MVKHDKKIFYVILGCLIASVAGLSIAYAALSSTLNINFGTVTQSVQTWNVAFKSETVNATSTGTSETGRTCGAATSGGDTVSIANTTLSKPQDKCVWKLTVLNTGSLDAVLAQINATAPTGGGTCTVADAKNVIECGNIKFTLATNTTGTPLTTGGTLANTSGSLFVYLIAEYKDVTTLSNTSSAITLTGTKFQLIYNQQ